jgi:hypothetical protein
VGTPAWPDVLAAYARAASDPLKRPAIAAPVITAFDGLIMYQLSLYGVCFPLLRDDARRTESAHAPKSFQKEVRMSVFYSAEQIHSSSEFLQRCTITTAPVQTCFVGTEVDCSNPIAILTPPDFD